MRRTLYTTVLGLGLVAGLNACAADETKTATPGCEGAMCRQGQTIQSVAGVPAWVTQKGAAFSGERRVFNGVGNAAGIINPSLMRKAAEASARQDLAKTFKTYVAAMTKQYQASTMGGSANNVSEEQHIEAVSKELTEHTLMGASIAEYWENPTRNEAYALARLDIQQFLDTLSSISAANSQYKELDAKMKEYIKANAAKAHDDLNQELQKGK
jgi:hypothetical protein